MFLRVRGGLNRKTIARACGQENYSTHNAPRLPPRHFRSASGSEGTHWFSVGGLAKTGRREPC